VFRDLLARETLAPPWRELLQVYRKMEARGEIRGGRFVAGFLGEQFARPEALDLLRHVRRSEASATIDVSAADPLNLSGIILPGVRTGALDATTVRIVEASSLAAPRLAVALEVSGRLKPEQPPLKTRRS
jgi:ATP-dependent helicase Lhr and Lhr-like helicase